MDMTTATSAMRSDKPPTNAARSRQPTGYWLLASAVVIVLLASSVCSVTAISRPEWRVLVNPQYNPAATNSSNPYQFEKLRLGFWSVCLSFDVVADTDADSPVALLAGETCYPLHSVSDLRVVSPDVNATAVEIRSDTICDRAVNSPDWMKSMGLPSSQVIDSYFMFAFACGPNNTAVIALNFFTACVALLSLGWVITLLVVSIARHKSFSFLHRCGRLAVPIVCGLGVCAGIIALFTGGLSSGIVGISLKLELGAMALLRFAVPLIRAWVSESEMETDDNDEHHSPRNSDPLV